MEHSARSLPSAKRFQKLQVCVSAIPKDFARLIQLYYRGVLTSTCNYVVTVEDYQLKLFRLEKEDLVQLSSHPIAEYSGDTNGLSAVQYGDVIVVAYARRHVGLALSFLPTTSSQSVAGCVLSEGNYIINAIYLHSLTLMVTPAAALHVTHVAVGTSLV